MEEVFLKHSPHVVDKARKIKTELEGRIDEAKAEAAERVRSGYSASRFPPSDEYKEFIERVLSFLTTLLDEQVSFKKIIGYAREVEDAARLIPGSAASAKITGLHKGVKEILDQASGLAQDFIRGAIELNIPGTSREKKAIEFVELPNVVPDQDIPPHLSHPDVEFYKTFWPLVRFIAAHKKNMEMSSVSEDHTLYNCVTLADALVSDYLRGFEVPVSSITSSLVEIEGFTASIQESGGDIKGFPYYFCDSAYKSIGLLYQRVATNIPAYSGFREALIPEEDMIAPRIAVNKKIFQGSALSELRR